MKICVIDIALQQARYRPSRYLFCNSRIGYMRDDVQRLCNPRRARIHGPRSSGIEAAVAASTL